MKSGLEQFPVEGIEPVAAELYQRGRTADLALNLSIAISLRRLADHITGPAA